jgi:putative ABC transport system permease protein
MKYFPLIWAALWRRKLRTWFTLISVVTAFFLFGMLQGVNLGIEGLLDLMTTDRVRTRSRNDGDMPLAHLQQIEALPGVTATTPINVVPGNALGETSLTVVLGIDVEAWFEVIYNPQFNLPKEALAAMQRTRNGIVVGKVTADDKGWKVGDVIPIQAFAIQNKSTGTNAWEFEIVGIWDIPNRPNWATNIFANYDYINEARAEGANASTQYITRIDDPAKYAEVATAVDELFANSPAQTLTMSEEDFLRTVLAQVGNVSYLLNGVVGAVLFTLLFLTANTMTLSVRERVPELAALKTLGFTDIALLVMVLVEVLLLCLVAGGVGLGASAGVFPVLMKTLGPNVGLEGMRIPGSVYAWGAGIAALLALVSGLPPALRAMRLNIVDGLANR